MLLASVGEVTAAKKSIIDCLAALYDANKHVQDSWLRYEGREDILEGEYMLRKIYGKDAGPITFEKLKEEVLPLVDRMRQANHDMEKDVTEKVLDSLAFSCSIDKSEPAAITFEIGVWAIGTSGLDGMSDSDSIRRRVAEINSKGNIHGSLCAQVKSELSSRIGTICSAWDMYMANPDKKIEQRSLARLTQYFIEEITHVPCIARDTADKVKAECTRSLIHAPGISLPKDSSAERENRPSGFAPKSSFWRDVNIRFTDGHTVRITVNGKAESLNYSQLGAAFTNKRNGNPTVQWAFLRGLAKHKGNLDKLTIHATKVGGLKQTISRTNRGLSKFFGIEGQAITAWERGYGWQAQFTIRDESERL